jgi:hypothetical protein
LKDFQVLLVIQPALRELGKKVFCHLQTFFEGAVPLVFFELGVPSNSHLGCLDFGNLYQFDQEGMADDAAHEFSIISAEELPEGWDAMGD